MLNFKFTLLKLCAAILLIPLLCLSSIRLISELIVPTDLSSLWAHKASSPPLIAHGPTVNILSRLDPLNADYKHMLAWNLWSVDLGMAEKAIMDATGRSAIDPKNWILLGWIKGREGLIDEGSRSFDRALMLNPRRPDSLAQHGLYIYQTLSKLDERARNLFKGLAELSLRAAMELDPAFSYHPEYVFTLARLYKDRGDAHAASSILKNIKHVTPGDFPSAIKNLALYIQFGKYLTAIAQWEALFNPDKLNSNEIESIEKELNKYGIIDFNYFLARIHIHQGRQDIALNELRALVTARGDIAEYRLALGDLHERTGNGREALAQYEKVLEISPANEKAREKVIGHYGKR